MCMCIYIYIYIYIYICIYIYTCLQSFDERTHAPTNFFFIINLQPLKK